MLQARTPLILHGDNLVPFGELLHGISTRHGGVSDVPYDSLNLSFDVGDCRERVMQNYLRLSRLLHCDLSSLVACQQVHHNAIAIIGETTGARVRTQCRNSGIPANGSNSLLPPAP